MQNDRERHQRELDRALHKARTKEMTERLAARERERETSLVTAREQTTSLRSSEEGRKQVARLRELLERHANE